MTTTTKFHKVFGQVEVLEVTATITTICIVKTGEVKKMVNAYTVLSDEPFIKPIVKRVKPLKLSDLTEEELQAGRERSTKERRQLQYIASLPLDERIAARHDNARRIALS